MEDLFTHMIICHQTTNCFSSFSRLHCLCTQSVHSYYYVIIISAMEEDISIAAIAVNTTLIFAAALLILRRLRRKKRRVWVREILCKRRQEGAHHLLIPQLMSDGQHYKKFFRLSKEDYGYILDKVSPIIARKDSNLRQSITPSERLAVTLRYLATSWQCRYLLEICYIY